jgi:hypothetical protein
MVELLVDELSDGSRVVTNNSTHQLTVVRADGDTQPFEPGHTMILEPGDSVEGRRDERVSDGR